MRAAIVVCLGILASQGIATAFGGGLPSSFTQIIGPSVNFALGGPAGQSVQIPTDAFQQLDLQIAPDSSPTSVQNAVSGGLKANGIVPNGDALSSVLKLNDANSFVQLQDKSAVTIPILKSKSYDQPIWINANVAQKLKIESQLFDLGAKATVTTGSFQTSPQWKQVQESVQAFDTIGQAQISGTTPLSADFLGSFSRDIGVATELTDKIQSGQTLTPNETLALGIINSDSQFRAQKLESDSAGSGDFGNGNFEVNVALLDDNKQPVKNYRVEAAPPWLTDRPYELPGVTSPASGSLPWGTYCFYAVDSSNQVISLTKEMRPSQLYGLPTQTIDLVYKGPNPQVLNCSPEY